MIDLEDLKLLIKSRTPVIVIESNEEQRVVELCKELARQPPVSLFKWTVTSGLRRVEHGYSPQKFNTEPRELLQHIKSSSHSGIYLLLDFHPYLEDPFNIRLIREIAQTYREVPGHLILLSPQIEIPKELKGLSVKYKLALPDSKKILEIIRREALNWNKQNAKKVVADKKAVQLLARNLTGLTASDAARLARNAISDDGAITQSDVKRVMQAKYELINQDGVLAFEYDTAAFADVGGLRRLKAWLKQRRAVFHGQGARYGLEAPKGIMLLGVQGCGKSLAAKAVSGMWNIPLLRLDFAGLYNKYMGETERNLRASLETAEIMAPCVLWIDEIEKGLSTGTSDDGVSRRVLGTLLTWMNEKKKPVFIVATANDVTSLPPELLRKGRFDELFFVDLPDDPTRRDIFCIQLSKRKLEPAQFDLPELSEAADGFSGAEIEQAVVSSLYTALAADERVTTGHILQEIETTRPLSVLMREKIDALRHWASERTVPAN
jgi:SpoVK/Ycf46/Vps4 family AAA+-type ATPase